MARKKINKFVKTFIDKSIITPFGLYEISIDISNFWQKIKKGKYSLYNQENIDFLENQKIIKFIK